MVDERAEYQVSQVGLLQAFPNCEEFSPEIRDRCDGSPVKEVSSDGCSFRHDQVLV